VRILYTNATEYVRNVEYNDNKKERKNMEYPDDNISGKHEKNAKNIRELQEFQSSEMLKRIRTKN
jgi:hypothetical protein